MARKIAVCTTFPSKNFNICTAEMLATFKAYWPEDVKIFIQLDEMPESEFNQLNNAIIDILGEGRVFIAGQYDEDQKEFIDRWKDHKPDNYMFDIVRFSHKVFALEKCADAIKDDIDVLIWLDDDVITKRLVSHEWLESVLPAEDEVCSYLGREGLYSECGFVAYNLKNGGYELLKTMKNTYLDEKEHVLNGLPNGLTDCHVFDACLYGEKAKNLSDFYSHGVSPIDVWPNSALAEKMVHRKGNRKHVAAQNREKTIQSKPEQRQQVIDANNINIKTRNCLDHEKICSNVRQNLSQIRCWATLTKPVVSTRDGQQQDIVICSAGPSLADHIEEIRERQRNGAKVIAVKHAIDTLRRHKITPWAVVLLDPRAHVEGFVNNPDPEPFYFVASMCDPSVVKTLNDSRCKVIGYHALVNAGEMNEMIAADLPVSGGSATSTRTIGLFSDMFGYKNFHLYGYDLCYQQKPNMSEVNEEGQPKYMELDIGTYTYGNKYVTRTFWTEGQFLAQSNELANLYKDRKDLNITVYGDGMAGWLYKHWKAYKKFQKEYNEGLDNKRNGAPTLDEYVNAATRGSELARGA